MSDVARLDIRRPVATASLAAAVALGFYVLAAWIAVVAASTLSGLAVALICLAFVSWIAAGRACAGLIRYAFPDSAEQASGLEPLPRARTRAGVGPISRGKAAIAATAAPVFAGGVFVTGVLDGLISIYCSLALMGIALGLLLRF